MCKWVVEAVAHSGRDHAHLLAHNFETEMSPVSHWQIDCERVQSLTGNVTIFILLVLPVLCF